jgi:hypothetical protein
MDRSIKLQALSNSSNKIHEQIINVYILYIYCLDFVEILEYNCNVENKKWLFIRMMM